MAIVKNNFRVSRPRGEFSPKDSMSTDEDELRKQSSASEGSEGSEFDEEEDDEDADSGMGSDDVDLSELGEVGEELCQVGSQLCSVPFELYDLEGLGEVLSVDVWNECLSEEERFGLAKYLPDMDQEAFVRTMKELFSGENFHFGSPIAKLFEMMKGGMCEPRVMLYQHGWSCFQKFRHYHHLREYQNFMVGKFVGINNAWLGCKGYGIEERLRVLKLMGSQKTLMYDKREDMVLGSDSSGREELGDGLWTKKAKGNTHGSKRAHQHMYMGSPTVDASSRGRTISPELAKYGKQNPKGLLKLGGSKGASEENLIGSYPSSHHGLEVKSRPYGLSSAMLGKESVAGYDVGAARQVTEAPKAGKEHAFMQSKDRFADDALIGIPLSLKHDNLHSHRKNWNVNHMAEMTMNHNSGFPNYRDTGKKAKYFDGNPYALVEDQAYSAKSRPPLSKAIPVEAFSRHQTYRDIRPKEESNPLDHQHISDWNVRGDKYKMQPELRTNRNNVGSDMFPPSSHRSPKLGKKTKREPHLNGFDLEEYTQSDETESDSSDHVDEEDTPLRSKQGYPVLANKLPKKEKVYGLPHPGVSYSSKAQNDDLGERLHLQDVEVYTVKGKQRGKNHDPRYLHKYSTGISDESAYADLAKVAYSSGKKAYKSPKIGQMPFKANPSMKNKKGFVDHEYHVPRSNYTHSYMDDDSDLHVTPSPKYLDGSMKTDRMGRRGQSTDAADHHDRSSMPLLECSSLSKKRKAKMDVTYMSGVAESDMYATPQQPIDDLSTLKKRGKRDLEAESDSVAMLSSEKGLVDVDSETKPGKKPFTLITPSIHTGFSFSIIHLLSAVRVAIVTPLADDVLDISKHVEQNGKHEPVSGKSLVQSQDVTDASVSEQVVSKNMPSLTVQEIVNRVKSNPGDPCILETQEPLQDLVRGVLKIFASKTAPLGAKGWKALVSYEKSTKSWSWIGPVSSSTPDPDTVEEVTSCEAWGLPHKMLVKLVDSFANWLKNGQDTLQQIGSLPAPPLALMQPNLDEKERFRDLRAQKSLTTITPSSEEVRAYFRKEEILRYLVPDRAFSYTAADGKKSIVAPLRRGGGKPTSKARDHPILKPDRPPHVTILCLVRDAAARLPGSIGTRADVCTLIRDSQYIVEDVTDAQVNQVVSGALDRLHYERDPCVQFDGERKLWVYLHRDREEEDFEDDGTSSTKKWKRPRKDAAEQSEATNVNAAYHGIGEQLPDGSEVVYMISTDVKVESSSTHAGQGTDLIYNALRPNEDVNVGPFVGTERDRLHQGHAIGWEVLNLNPMRENKMICQENSTNEDYDDENFSRDRSVGLFNTSIKNGVR